MAEYVEVSSEEEVNLSDRVRKETQGRVLAVLEALDQVIVKF